MLGPRQENITSLTEHVALLVLPALTVGNVALDSEMEHRQVFDGVLVRIQSSNEAETCSIVDVATQLLQPWAQVGQGKVLPRDSIPVQTQG